MKHSRGQTMVETVVAMPVILLALFAIIYMARFGIVSERAELALRYGGIEQFDAGSGAYSVANIYKMLSPSASWPCPSPPVSIFADASPFPGPTSAPFWQPDTDVSSPSTGCGNYVASFGGAQFMATHYFGATVVSVNAGVDVPAYLQKLLGKSASISTSAQFIHPADPGLILNCSKEVHDRVWGAITAESTTVTPPPGPPNNGVCQ